MIDPADKQTQQLPLEAKRGRGRPSTGKALSPAEKQKAYRERIKGNVTDDSEKVKRLEKHLAYVKETDETAMKRLIEQIDELKIALDKEVAARKKAEAKLISVTANRDQKETGKAWDVESCGKGRRTWKRVEGEPFESKGMAENFIKGVTLGGSESRYRVIEVSLA